MKTIWVVTTVEKLTKGSKEVVLGAYEDKELAEQIAIKSLTAEAGVLRDTIECYKVEGFESPIVERIVGKVKEWGKWCEGADWHTQTSFWMAAKVEEVILN